MKLLSTRVSSNKGLTMCQVLLCMCCSAYISAAETEPAPEQPADDNATQDGTHIDGNVEAEINALLHEAKAFEQAGRFADAREIYRKVLKITPGNYDIRRKVQEVGLERTDVAFSYFVQQQLMAVEAQAHLLHAQQFYEEGQIQRALDELDYAEALHMRTNNALPQSDLLRLHELRMQLHQARRDKERAELERKRLENQRRMVALVEKNEDRQRSIFEQRLSRITRLVQKGHYERALSLTRNLVVDYPGEPAADTMFMHVVDLAHQQRRLDFEESRRELKREIRHQMHEGLIPKAWDGYPIYPDDWDVRVAQRQLVDQAVELPEWQERLQNKMAERTSVRFEDQDISDALDFLSTRLGVNIVVDPDIRTSGTIVNIHARNMTLANIVSWLARQADTQWQYFNEAVYFGVSQDKEVITRVYDASQLIYQPPDFPGVELALNSNAGSDGGGAGLFDDADVFGDDGGIAPEDLIDLLQLTVNPTGWDEYDDWGVRIRGSTLMVTTTADTHLLIQQFINSMRNANDILVNISARWVTISDLFVEEIGVNWLNRGRIDNYVGEGIHSNRPNDPGDDVDYGINVEHVLPTSAVDTAQTIISRGLFLDFAFMDAFQAIAVLEAVQFKEKGRLLEAIDLSVHNGSRANAAMIDSIAYIRDYDVETGTTGVGNGSISRLDPQIGILQTGAALDIQPFVSSDRKYVTLDVRPSFSTVEFNVAEIVAVQQIPGTNAPVQIFFPIELPVVRVKQARTRVMIPDKGSILVGGFGEHIEQNSYAQIPVLGNLPFLGRLFGRRAIRESRRSLYLTMSAKITVFSEMEKLQ